MSFQREHGILVATVAAYKEPPSSSRWLVESARRYGYQLTLLGQGRPYLNNRYKIGYVAEYLEAHPEYQYVLQVDYRDVIFCASLREMFHKYQSIGHAIVAAAERECWPIQSHAPRSPETGKSYRYLNSGTIFSTTKAWLDAWAVMQKHEIQLNGKRPELGRSNMHILNDDQAAWTEVYVNNEADIALDADCMLFQALATVNATIGTSNSDFRFEGVRVMNRETGGRPCLIHCNGTVKVESWAQYILNPSTVWIWPLIERIRTAPIHSLRDIEYVSRLLLELGLHDSFEGEIEDALLPYSGKGLAIWQQPKEFARYLTWLAARPPIRSYLEIGVAAGGSFITTIEFLRRFHPLEIAIGVDPTLSAPVRDYVARTSGVHFIQGIRASCELQKLMNQIGALDLVFIDGDHSPESVRADWDLSRCFSRYVSFHDISSSFAGPCDLWAEIESTYERTYNFSSHQGSLNMWGLGLVDLAFGRKGIEKCIF